MSLSIIGAGLPRTGTTSLTAALAQLGLGPCYEGSIWINRLPEHCGLWMNALDGQTVDWDRIFEGFAVTISPGRNFYRQLAEHYPQAKVILTIRDADRWFESTQTILSPAVADSYKALPPAFNTLTHRMGWHPDDPENHDRARMIARLNAHNEEVKATIDPERLLVYDVAQGWEPLCAFLGVAIPETPFPRVNTTDDLKKIGEAPSAEARAAAYRRQQQAPASSTAHATPQEIVIAGGELDGSATGADVYLGVPKAAYAPPGKACQMAKRYVEFVNVGQFAQIADLFEGDAVILDQTGKDALGRDQIEAYYETTIGQMKGRQIVAVSYLGDDDDCMVELAAQITVQGQLRYLLTSIDHFTLADSGKIARLVAFGRPLKN